MFQRSKKRILNTINKMNDYISEQRRQYTTKNIDISILRNPPIKCNALHFIKPFEEAHLRLAPRPLQKLGSIYKNDFHGDLLFQDERISLMYNRQAIQNREKLTIDHSKPGYTKYLDISATSNRLDYFPYSFDQKSGIGAKDNITYWTWIKNETNGKYNVWPIKENTKINRNKVYKRRNEFQILQNSLPHAGLITETKSKFKKPERSMDFDLKCISEQISGSDTKQ